MSRAPRAPRYLAAWSALAAVQLASCHLATGIEPCTATGECSGGRVCDVAFGVCRDTAIGDDGGAPPRDAGARPDGGPHDAGGADAGPDDGGVDAGDAGSTDAGALDAGLQDAGVDAGPDGGTGIDAGLLDAGVDAGGVDGGQLDAGAFDAGLSDAGLVDAGTFDAGLLDAGLLDAGVGDAGNLRFIVDVHAIDALAAGAAVPVQYPAKELSELGESGVRVSTADGGAAVPFVFDPATRADAGTTLWLRLPAAVGAGGHAFFALEPQAASSPAALDEVFLAGDAFDDATLSSVATDTVGTAFTFDGGQMDVDMDVESDAAVAWFDGPLARGTPFVARHKLRVTDVSPAGALSRQLGVLQGVAPAATEDNFGHFLRELIVVVSSPEGLRIWCTQPDTNLLAWNGTAWAIGGNIVWAAQRTDDLEVELDSDGTNWRVRVRDATGTILTETTPRTWAELIEPPDAGGATGPTWVFWGEVFAGPGASFFAADFSSDWAVLRTRAVQEPVVTVSAE